MANTQASIFYSWQSDLSTKTNQSLIEDALKKAAKALRKDGSLGVDPVIDRDTRGVAGSPDIHVAILEKIAKSDVAVFDVSFVQSGPRFHPNPNVLIELGYALGTIDSKRVILVLNTAWGEPEKLPFDIRTKRTITYSMKPEEEPAGARRSLATKLEARIREVLTQHPRVDSDTTAVAIKDLHDGKPGALASVRSALARLTSRLSEMLDAGSPKFAPEGNPLDTALAAYADTKPTMARFIELVTEIVDCQSEKSFDLVFGCLEQIASLQERPTGSFPSGACDAQRMLVRELLMAVVAICLRANAWPLLGRLVTHHFKFTHDLRERSGDYSRLPIEIADFLPMYEQANGNLRPGLWFKRVIGERYDSGLSPLTFKDLREADYFLYLASELRSKTDQWRWVPLLFWTENDKSIQWLLRAKSLAWTHNIAKAMGLEASTFVEMYQERWTRIAKIFQWWLFLERDLEWMLIKPDELATQP